MTGANTARPRISPKVKALAALVGTLLWLSVCAERPGESKVVVPVRPEHLAPAFTFVSAPRSVEVLVSGPHILLWQLPFRDVTCRIDLSAAAAGTTQYSVAEYVQLPDPELKVVRVAPASVEVTVEPFGAREAGGPGAK